jgi:hypothetical protein
LLALWSAIQEVRLQAIRDALAVAFSRCIIAKISGASYAIDLPHTRPHKRADKKVPDPLHVFSKRVLEVIRHLDFSRAKRNARKALIRGGDARKLPYRSQSIDLVLTSSPYANAIDYVRAHKFSLVWMGHSVTKLSLLRSKMIGAERGEHSIRPKLAWLEKYLPRAQAKTRRRRAILRRYFYDLDRVLAELHRVLRSGGACAFVVGRSRLGKEIVDTPSVLVQLAVRRGFRHLGTQMRAINPLRRSLPFSTSRRPNGLNKRMFEEAIIGLGK